MKMDELDGHASTDGGRVLAYQPCSDLHTKLSLSYCRAVLTPASFIENTVVAVEW